MRGGGQKERERDSNLTGMPGIAGMQLSISTRIYARVFNDSSLHPQPPSTHIHTHTHTHILSHHTYIHTNKHTQTHTQTTRKHTNTQAYVKAGAAVYKACGCRRRNNSPFSSSAPTKKVSVSTVMRACTERVCSLGHVWLVRACVRVQRERVCSDSPILYLYICPLHSNTRSLSLTHSLSLSLSLSHTHTHTPARSALLHTIYPSHTI